MLLGTGEIPLLEQHSAQQIVCVGVVRLKLEGFFCQRLGFHKLALLEAHRRKIQMQVRIFRRHSQRCFEKLRSFVVFAQSSAKTRNATQRSRQECPVFRRRMLLVASNLEGSSRVKMLL